MKRFTPLLAVACMILSLTAPAHAASALKMNDWAQKETARGGVLSLISDGLGSDYTLPITRMQFAGLSVQFVEQVTGKSIEKGSASFRDTSSETALKAAAAGIVKGTGDGTTFSPELQITREEIATMLFRAVRYVDTGLLDSGSATALDPFADAGTVSDWAKEPMHSVVDANIMRGVPGSRLLPKGSTSIDQAILLVYRSFALVVSNQAAAPAQAYADSQIAIQSKLQQQYAQSVGAGKAAVFTASRVNSVQLAEVYNDVENHPGTYLLFSMRYSLKADDPDAVVLAGGLEKDDEGWVTNGMPTTLLFIPSESGLELLGGYLTEFSADGNAQVFRSDFEQWLDTRGR